MIAELTGQVSHIDWENEELVLAVRGVGYGVHAPRSTLDRLGAVGEEVCIFTHLHVREDALALYGFSTRIERELFQLLLSVSKIGPKLALAVLSTMGADDVRRAVELEDVTLLTEVPGIGQKTAQRLILELRDKLGALPAAGPVVQRVSTTGEEENARREAEEALLALGYSRREALKALELAASELPTGAAVEELLKLGLRKLGARQTAD